MRPSASRLRTDSTPCSFFTFTDRNLDKRVGQYLHFTERNFYGWDHYFRPIVAVDRNTNADYRRFGDTFVVDMGLGHNAYISIFVSPCWLYVCAIVIYFIRCTSLDGLIFRTLPSFHRFAYRFVYRLKLFFHPF